MKVLAIGLSYRTAPVELRERLVFTRSELPAALTALLRYVGEGVILSTCNRIEVYAAVDDRRTGRAALCRFLSEYHQVAEGAFAALLDERYQEEAVRHVMRVAAGLDSMVLGEPQVLGQVRDALAAALTQGTAGAVLSRLFSQAIEVGKRARATTDISRHATSVITAAAALARNRLGELAGSTVLVVGAGDMGQLAAKTLVHHGATRVLVTGRTPAKVQQLAEMIGAEAVDFTHLVPALHQADIAVAATGANGYVICPQTVARALEGRRERPLVIIDIAVPRDVEPAVGQVPGATLYNIDDLEAVCRANLQVRAQESEKVEAMVAHEVERFVAWWQAREVVPTISALVEEAEAIRRAELGRALSRMGHLTAQDRSTIDALTAAIVKKMLHRPIVRLKEGGNGRNGREYVGAVCELFGLQDLRRCGHSWPKPGGDPGPAGIFG